VDINRRDRLWAGIDAGKGHHWGAVVNETGATLWSKKIDNDESAILTAIGEILDLADEVRWAVDISGTTSALLLALLAAHGQQAVYVPGRTVNRMSGAYRGEAKTDAAMPTSSPKPPASAVTSPRSACPPRPSLPWPADVPESCGHFCATTGSSPPPHRSRRRLDIVIETPGGHG
jgi:hypothetical protein